MSNAYHDGMAELILVRHAKSDWSDPSLRDHDRPLNGRGRKNAPEMADRLASTRVRVDLILSSTAVRARTTAEAFAEALGAPLELVSELYLASGNTLLGTARLAATRHDLETIMVVAHDPGITDLANDLSDGGIQHMPTAAVARFKLAGGWDTQECIVDTWDYDTVRGIAD